MVDFDVDCLFVCRFGFCLICLRCFGWFGCRVYCVCFL